MTPEELDIFLRTPTEHELQYLNGWKNLDHLLSLKLVSTQSRSIRIFQAPSSIFSLSYGKHSRFNQYPIHQHSWIELNYMYSGTCHQKINGKEIVLQQGQTILLDTDTIHEISVLGENDILLNIFIPKVSLSVDFLNRITQKNLISEFLINSITEGLAHDNFIFFDSSNRRRLLVLIQEFFCEYYDASECIEDILNSLFTLIITELIAVCRTNASQIATQPNQTSVLPILKYIETHYQTVTLKELATFFNLNPNYLSRLLKSKTGNSFQTLVTKQRMLTAKQLLTNSELSVTEVAQQIGYNNVTFFYRKFNEAYGCSPNDYRNKIH